MAETIRLVGARPTLPDDEHEHRRPELLRALSAAMIERLRLRGDDLLVDLCCGAAPFDVEILRQVPLRYQIIAIDSSEERLARIPLHTGIRRVKMNLTTFCELPVRYDKILMVDALARVGGDARFFASLFERLNGGGALLLVERWDAWRSRAQGVASLLRESGFGVEVESLTLGLADRFGMVTAARPRPQ